MKYIDTDAGKELFIDFSECIDAGISGNTIRNAAQRGVKNWRIINDPEDKRKLLIGYEELSETNKDKVRARYGNPHDLIARQPILRLLDNDAAAFDYFIAYTYGNGQALPKRRVLQYTRAASWLAMLKKAEANKKAAIKSLGISLPEFYSHVSVLMDQDKKNGADSNYDGPAQLAGDWPISYSRIRMRMRQYFPGDGKTPAYNSLIDKMYGNQMAAKVNDGQSAHYLKELLCDPVQKDDVLICMLYNLWAEANGYSTIGPGTVGKRRHQWGSEIDVARYGQSYYNEKYIRQAKGLRPTHPLALVEHDDNNIDFLFQDGQYQYHRYVSIVVMDSHCDLVLGKSYMQGDTPEQWQVGHAYLDAMYYIRSLTGGWYLPFEIKADQWALTNLTPFYNSIAKWVKPGHGNKHRGYIEPFFGSPHWKRAQQLLSADNYTGNNITAINAGVNPDVLDLSRRSKTRPMIGNEAEVQIERFFQLLQKMPAFTRANMNAPSKETLWLEAWNTMHHDDKRPISDVQFLTKFGIAHRPKHTEYISIGNRGVEPVIKGIKYSYDLPSLDMYTRLNGAKVKVIYDPYDMSRVLLTNEDDIRFIARDAKVLPRALKDQYTGSRTYLNAVLEEKVAQWGNVEKLRARAQKIVAGQSVVNGIGAAEALLKGGGLLKAIKNNAEQALIAQQGAGEYDRSEDEEDSFMSLIDKM